MRAKLFLVALPIIWILSVSFGSNKKPWEKDNVDFIMMNQEIKNTMKEDERQTEMHKKQITNVVAEGYNKSEWNKFKNLKRNVQSRLNSVSLLIQAAPAGIVISRELNETIENQEKLYQLVEDNLWLLQLLPNEFHFVQDAQDVLLYIVGVVSSYGIINQMEKAERKILIDYAINEVKRIKIDSHMLYFTAKDMVRKKNLNKAILQDIINKDKQIIQDILNNF